MSQSPYEPVYNFDYYQPADDPLAPARKAGVSVMVLGAFVLLFGACGAMAGAMTSPQEVFERQVALSGPQVRALTPETLHRAALALCIAMAVYGATLVALGPFIRRSRLAALVIGLVMVGIAAIVLLLMVLGAMGTLTAGGVFVLVILAPPVVLTAASIRWLIQALGNISRVRAAEADYARRYWEYYQQYQAWNQPQPPAQAPPPPPPARGGDYDI